MQASAIERVGNLVVVLEERDESARRHTARIGAARPLLPSCLLSLVEESPRGAAHQFLRRAEVVAIIRLAMTGGGNPRRMVEVIVPDRVQPVAIIAGGPDEPRVLVVVLGRDPDRPGYRGCARRVTNGLEDVGTARIEDLLRRVEPQPVEMELANPVGGVGFDERA